MPGREPTAPSSIQPSPAGQALLTQLEPPEPCDFMGKKLFWIAVGVALKSGAGPGHPREGFQLWLQFTATQASLGEVLPCTHPCGCRTGAVGAALLLSQEDPQQPQACRVLSRAHGQGD